MDHENTQLTADSKDSSDLYRVIFDASLDGLSIIDRNGIVVDVNPALGKIDGYTRDEVIGQRPPRFRDPSAHEALRQLIDRVLDGETFEAEVFLPHKDGSVRPAETRSARIVYLGAPHMLVTVRDLSERKQHEGELRRSEDRYRAMFEASLDGLVLLNADGLVVDVNPALNKLDGFSREDLIGQLPPAVRDPSRHEKHREYVAAILGGEKLESEGQLPRKDGSSYRAELRSVRVDFRGEPQILVVVRDVSERYQRELQLIRSEDQYRTVFDGMIDGLALIRSDGIVVDANLAMAEQDLFDRDKIVGKMPPTYIGDENKIAAHKEYVRRVLAGERVKNDFRFERSDGTFYHAEVRPIRINYNDEPHVLLVIRDVSEQRERDAALARSEDRLRSMVATALDSIIAMNEAGEIVDFNPAAEECFGYESGEVIGRKLEDVIIPPEYRAAHRNGLKHYLATGEGPYLGTRLEVQGMRRTGELLQMELSISVADGANGKIFIGYIRDLTEQQLAAQQSELLEAQLRQAQKMEAIGHLTGGIAHDFNNILTSILGYVTLARDRADLAADDKLDRYLERAERAGGRARDLIAQMMTFSRGRRGEKQDVNPTELVTETLSLLESSFPASLEIHTELEANVSTISIDPVHFEQVLVNLCINARDAMNGAGVLAVTVSQKQIDDLICTGCHEVLSGVFIELAVSDVGPGIDPLIVERIFEPFFTTKDVGKGSGMGLSTVHGIVHDHRGHVHVDSQIGEGTTMKVLLPISVDETPDRNTPQQSDATADAEKLSGRVLVVDDSSDVGEYLQDLLETWGLEVTVYGDAMMAREHLVGMNHNYNLVITDQTMPRLSGIDLAKSIVEVAPDLPIFLYTGYSESVTEELALSVGITAFLHKPLDTARLNTLIRGVIK